MDFDNLNYLPEWNDNNSFNDDEGDEWKTKELKAAGKALYVHWTQLFNSILAFSESLAPEQTDKHEETHQQFTQNLIYENAMMVAPKIISATNVHMYILQMENAAIIRLNCRQLMEQVKFAVLTGYGEESYEKVVEQGMKEFRELFKNWISHFKKDEIEDEWGLFGQ